MRTTVSWLWVAIAGLFGLAAIAEGHWVAALIIWGSALAALPTEAMHRELERQNAPKWQQPVVAAILGLVGLIIAGFNSRPVHPPSSVAAQVHPAIPSKVVIRETKTLWADIRTAAKPCDDIANDVANGADARNVYAFYEVTKNAEGVCSSSAELLASLTAPPSAGDQLKAEIETALTKCVTAFREKSSAYAKSAEVIDGNVRPSAVKEAKDALSAAATMQIACGLTFLQAASKAGIAAEAFKS